MGIFKTVRLNLKLPQFNLQLPEIVKEKCRRHTPVGTGEYTVGCVDIMCDHTRQGTFIRLYYPTEKTDIYQRQHQWPLWIPRKQYVNGYVYFRRNPKVLGTVFNWFGGDVYAPVLWLAPVLDSRDTKFPVIVFSHGLGGNRTTYTTICTDLASQGFVVAVLEHRDGSASMTYCMQNTMMMETETEPFLHHLHSFREEWLKYARQKVEDDFHVRNKQVYHRVEECQRALNILEAMNEGKTIHNVLGHQFNTAQFRDLLDIDRAAVVGHSFGGATAIASLAIDKRFKVGVGLDSWMLPLDDTIYCRVTQPLLLINTEIFQWKKNVQNMLRLKPDGENTKLITLRGTCHQSQSDFQFLVHGTMGRLLGLRHTLDPYTAIDLNQKATLGFLWKHLGIEGKDYHEDILAGNHQHVMSGTNVNLQCQDEQCYQCASPGHRPLHNLNFFLRYSSIRDN